MLNRIKYHLFFKTNFLTAIEKIISLKIDIFLLFISSKIKHLTTLGFTITLGKFVEIKSGPELLDYEQVLVASQSSKLEAICVKI